jgi:TPR repeat protein
MLKEDTQLTNEQLFINNLLNEKMSQIIQNFSRVNIKEIEPLMSFEDNFDIMVNEIILFLESVEIEMRKIKIINYLNDHNIASQEIYNWLLNNQDNPSSIFLLGVFNYFGISINVDKHKAFELYQDAANSEDVSGIISLGYCYEKGAGANVDRQKAFELYQKSANLGNILAISNLGYCYRNGIGTNVDIQKAFELYQKAANLGYYLAQYNLALMYEFGDGIKKDINQAINWYKKSSEQGYKYSQNELNKLIN